MTKTEEKLLAAMKYAVASGAWHLVPGHGFKYTIRWDSEEKLPPANMLDSKGQIGGWHGDWAYQAMVFLTLIQGTRILGVSRCPWVGRSDEYVTFKRAFEVLEDPTIAL